MKPSSYRYVKAPIVIITQVVPKPPNPWKRLFGPVLMTVGSVMIANVIWPILSYQLINSPQFQRTELIAPIPKEALGSTPNKEIVASRPELPVAQVQGADLDYTKASNWFPDAQLLVPEKPESYTLSIPSLNISNAVVNIGSEDLNKSLIHYVGTALPGKLGSPVIFGHSILRQFYNPVEKNPYRYMSIFSKIMTLTTGDRIFIDYDGIKYTYEVNDKVEVSSEDLFILEQRYSNRELKLITCVPEGTSLRRGVVVAQLVDLQ